MGISAPTKGKGEEREPVPIAGYEGIYSIYPDGAVYGHKGTRRKGDFLTHKVQKGYHFVGLMKQNKRKFFRINRLVAATFLPNPSNLPFVNHKDGNKSNNHISNLEWCDASHNMKHAYRLGLVSQVGEKNASAKLNPDKVALARVLRREGVMYKTIASIIGAHKETVRDAVIGRNWAHVA